MKSVEEIVFDQRSDYEMKHPKMVMW